MTTKRNGNSAAKTQKWIKEGRGSGRGKEYKPWLTVRDVASSGRSHRIFGHKSQRTHHLLSDLELAVFLLLEWKTDTVDIREQFPLRLRETSMLAEEAGIAHPSVRGEYQVMSSDFLVITQDKSLPKFVLQVKYASALQDRRTTEKLEIERRYWQGKKIPWFLVTEREIPASFFDNINWLYPAKRDELTPQEIFERIEYYSYHFRKKSSEKLIEFAKSLDIAYEQESGQALLEIRALLANRLFLFDISIPFRKLKVSDLKIGNISALMEDLRVSNQ